MAGAASLPTASNRPVVAIAGATGFVGTALRTTLASDYHVRALTRSPARKQSNARRDSPVEWRHCDLFDPYAVQQALQGVDYVLYLVHSLHASARLTQARAPDLDLLLADNVARAAETQNVKQIITLGGLVPDMDNLPQRLRSRREVENALASCKTPLTALRAGLIVGRGGTWLRMLINLVRRVPIMILPSWTSAKTQPIVRADVVRAIEHVLGTRRHYSATYDLGGPDVMSYREMLKRTARVLGLSRPMGTVPVTSPRLSKLWVWLFSGAPWALVSPFVDSLRYQAAVDSNPLQEELRPGMRTFEQGLRSAVDENGRPYPNPRSALRSEDQALMRKQSMVRSVQRLPLPSGYTARDVANQYMRWLPRIGGPLLRCTVARKRVCRIQLKPLGITLLELSYAPDRSPTGRQLFYVTGGLLARMPDGAHNAGRLEFRRTADGTHILAAIHDFSPMLPWKVYNATQAVAHLLVMNGFGRHLQHLADRRSNAQPAPTPTPSRL
ncbi:MAG: NAD(P)H-binding protein [Longimonas sp.]|uniref:NAD(P)H-binding protein n=1 Tax=Longimonas sp. TaxID=2039626 RepID=UPI0039769DAE